MEAAKELLQGLKLTPQILTQFVETIPIDKMHVRRGKGFWTLAEHVSHLAVVQPMLLGRLERFTREDHPEFVPYVPAEGDEKPSDSLLLPVAVALDQFAYYRKMQLQLLEAADDGTWSKTATHPEYEEYSFLILTRHTLTHDHWHMYRMEELWLARNAYLT
jgi:uncharacterized damage-inducible protein DinB